MSFGQSSSEFFSLVCFKLSFIIHAVINHDVFHYEIESSCQYNFCYKINNYYYVDLGKAI